MKTKRYVCNEKCYWNTKDTGGYGFCGHLYRDHRKISVELAKRLNIAPEKALQLFYESQTCADLHDKSTGLYLYGDLYVCDEFMREKEYGR